MLRKYPISRQSGFTLIELIISMGLGIAAVSAIMFFYLTTVTSSTSTLKKAKLNQELASAMTLIVQDLRRAGITQMSDAIRKDPRENLFNSVDFKLSIWKSASTWTEVTLPQVETAQCVTFAYDQNLNGLVEVSDLIGFRINNTNIQVFNGSFQTPFTCNASGWNDLFDTNEIEITKLTFDMTESVCVNISEPDGEDDDGDGLGVTDDDPSEHDCFPIISGVRAFVADSGDLISEIRNIRVTIAGRLTSESDISLELVEDIRVRNDRYYDAP